MPEPTTLSTIISAATTAGTATLITLGWNSARGWLATLFANHPDKAREKGIENATGFLKELRERVDALEKAGRASEQLLSTILERPDFSVLFQTTVLGAAQTDNRDKHRLLSRLIEERLQASPESLISLTSRMACRVVPDMTPNQLRILGLLANVWVISPHKSLFVNVVRSVQSRGYEIEKTLPDRSRR